MLRHCFIILFVLSMLVPNGRADTLESVRLQFEIYQRFSGEMEILSGNDDEEIDGVLKRTEAKRLAVRKELDRADTARKREKPISPLYAEEYALPFIHYASVERVFARRALEQGNPEEMLLSVQYVYRLADELAAWGPLELQTVAALIRLQMLENVQLLMFHPACKREHHEMMYRIFETQLDSRATDTVIWTQYREEGKRFYADVAKHGLENMVSPLLLKELEDRNAFMPYKKKVAERTAHDLSVFNQVSEVIVDMCSVPYYERQSALRLLEKELRDHRGTATEPVLALLLLRDVSPSMRLFAQERSGMETAYIALAAALGKLHQRSMRNLLTGKEYQVRLISDGIACTYEGNVKPFYVLYR